MLKNLNLKRALITLLALTQSSHCNPAPTIVQACFGKGTPLLTRNPIGAGIIGIAMATVLLVSYRQSPAESTTWKAWASCNVWVLVWMTLSLCSPLLSLLSPAYGGIISIVLCYIANLGAYINSQSATSVWQAVKQRWPTYIMAALALLVPELLALCFTSSIMMSALFSVLAIALFAWKFWRHPSLVADQASLSGSIFSIVVLYACIYFCSPMSNPGVILMMALMSQIMVALMLRTLMSLMGHGCGDDQ